jgi:post-GPI attachment to proteins factor 3
LTRISYYSDTAWTETLYFSSAAAFLGYSLILAILRTLELRDEASRVMVAAPTLAFVTTHILYLNFYELDKGTDSCTPDFLDICTIPCSFNISFLEQNIVV